MALHSVAGQKDITATLHILGVGGMKYVGVDLRWQEGREDRLPHSSYTYEDINRHSVVLYTLKDK